MRIVPAIVLAAVLVPAAAAARPPEADRAAQAAAALQNPLVQDGVARTLTQLADIVLDMRVGPLAALAAPEAGLRPDETLRNVQQRTDPDFDRHLRESTRAGVATMGAVAGGVAAQSAEIGRTVARLDSALAPLIAALGSATDDRPR